VKINWIASLPAVATDAVLTVFPYHQPVHRCANRSQINVNDLLLQGSIALGLYLMLSMSIRWALMSDSRRVIVHSDIVCSVITY